MYWKPKGFPATRAISFCSGLMLGAGRETIQTAFMMELKFGKRIAEKNGRPSPVLCQLFLCCFIALLLPGPNHSVLPQPELPTLLKSYYMTLKFCVVFILIVLLTCHWNFAAPDKVTFVANQNNGNIFFLASSAELYSEFGGLLKACSVCDGVDNQVCISHFHAVVSNPFSFTLFKWNDQTMLCPEQVLLRKYNISEFKYIPAVAALGMVWITVVLKAIPKWWPYEYFITKEGKTCPG